MWSIRGTVSLRGVVNGSLSGTVRVNVLIIYYLVVIIDFKGSIIALIINFKRTVKIKIIKA